MARREGLQIELLKRARVDDRITGAAVTGSGADGTDDRWSDVDLFFGVDAATPVERVLEDWSTAMYRDYGAIHHFDLQAGPTVYRAFLLPQLLEIDLGFTPADQFGPLGPGGFRVEFGAAAERRTGRTDPAHLVGLAWHHVLHARISVERAAPWQAEYWISAVRDQTIALACLRLGRPAAYAKGADRLPAEVTDPLRESLVRSLDADELRRALRAATSAFLTEVHQTDPVLARRLAPALRDIAGIRG